MSSGDSVRKDENKSKIGGDANRMKWEVLKIEIRGKGR